MGASRGIGRGIAEALAARGARVALCSRTPRDLEEVAAELDTETAVSRPTPTTSSAWRSCRPRSRRRSGRSRSSSSTPAGPPPGGALDNAQQQWGDGLPVAGAGPAGADRGDVAGMRERGWGRIVNVASSSVREPIAGLALSNAHRMATVGLFKTLASRDRGDGVTVNTVGTGRFATERLGRDLRRRSIAAEEQARGGRARPAGSGDPEEYGDLVAFLCSERAAYLTGP